MQRQRAPPPEVKTASERDNKNGASPQSPHRNRQVSGAPSFEDLLTQVGSSSCAAQPIIGQNQQQKEQFRQWASMSIDLSENGSAKLSPAERFVSGNKQQPPDSSVCFMSDPSISEEELTDVGSSRADHRKKLLYRQRMKDFDTRSVGDTSLSSSNISPTPQRFRIQFESSSDQIRSNIGKMRQKIKGAAERLSISSMIRSETSGSKTNGDSSNERQSSSETGTLAADDILQAALMPPSSLSATGTPPQTESSSGGAKYALNSPVTFSGVPPMPTLGVCCDDEQGEVSLSSSDSVRGISITQEQYGGESSSSALRAGSIAINNLPSTAMPPRGNIASPPKQFLNGDKSRPATDPSRRTRRRGGGPSHHRRMRSGDAVAAVMMNPGGEDWLGMNMNGIYRPGGADDDDESSSPLAAGARDGDALRGRRSHERLASAVWDGYSVTGYSAAGYSAAGYSADASAADATARWNGDLKGTVFRGPPRPFVQSANENYALSGDSFDFSDSAAGSIPHKIRHHPGFNLNRHSSSSFDPDTNRVRDRGNHVRYATAMDVVRDRGGHARYATLMDNSNNQSCAMWLPSYRAVETRDGDNAHNCRPDNDDSSSPSSGLSASITSSSYTDNSERLRKNEPSPRRSRRVKFDSPSSSKFDKMMKRVESVLDKPFYRDKAAEEEDKTKQMPMFFCPNCKTMQRDFINFATAAGNDSPQGYLAVYFFLYIVIALVVFGLEEGWSPLDCVYFSVITLTTAGLGDLVPSSVGAKIVCACFIYIGVATIGLLLGNLLAGSMDTARIKDARAAQIRDCPNCLRLEKARLRSLVTNANLNPRFNMGNRYQELKQNLSYTARDVSTDYEDAENIGLDLFEKDEEPNKDIRSSVQSAQSQIHCRHMSIDITGRLFGNSKLTPPHMSAPAPPPIDESTPFLGTAARSSTDEMKVPMNSLGEAKSFDGSYSSSSNSTDSSYDNPSKPMTRVKAGKYIILTLNKALMRSSLIIAAGSFGFHYIEDMSPADSFYFTTVLLTSVGYGDIVPVTTLGKVFATIFVVVAGTVLLHNMTLISMIPLDLRKRRIEQAVLGQFGDQLTDDELRELSTGRLIHRLKLATDRPDGLEECTREMFSLAMLVRLGRISEEDVKATFAAFRRLDAGNNGKLDSRTIIEGQFMRRKSLRNLTALSPPECEQHWNQPHHLHNFSMESMLQGPSSWVDAVHHGSPNTNPFMNPIGSSTGSFRRKPSFESYYSQGAISYASSFDYDAYERWSSSFDHYSSPKMGK